MYETVVSRRVALLGPAHKDTLAAKKNLCVLLATELGELVRPLELAGEIEAATEAEFGPAHPSTIQAKQLLLMLLQAQRDGILK